MTDAIAPVHRIVPLGPKVHHYWRVKRMARATDTDVTAAWDAGTLTQSTWTGMIETCRACQWAEGCGRWLDRPQDAPRDVPASCPNRAVFAELRSTQGKDPTA